MLVLCVVPSASDVTRCVLEGACVNVKDLLWCCDSCCGIPIATDTAPSQSLSSSSTSGFGVAFVFKPPSSPEWSGISFQLSAAPGGWSHARGWPLYVFGRCLFSSFHHCNQALRFACLIVDTPYVLDVSSLSDLWLDNVFPSPSVLAWFILGRYKEIQVLFSLHLFMCCHTASFYNVLPLIAVTVALLPCDIGSFGGVAGGAMGVGGTYVLIHTREVFYHWAASLVWECSFHLTQCWWQDKVASSSLSSSFCLPVKHSLIYRAHFQCPQGHCIWSSPLFRS